MALKILSTLGLVSYAITSHIALINQWLWLAFALALAPLVLTAASIVIRQWLNPRAKILSKPVLIFACLISVMSLFNYWASLSRYTEWLFLAQNVGANAALGVMFGATLLPHKTPLITQFARILHGHCTPAMLQYTRSVTWVWVLFFAAMCVISLGLFFFAPLALWSAFINLLAWPLVGALFVAEFAWRTFAHPEFEVVSLRDGIAAFMRHYSGNDSTPIANPRKHSTLMAHSQPQQLFAYLDEQAINAGQFLSDVAQVASVLPDASSVLNLCTNRYRFSVTLAATLIKRQVCLLPASLTPNMVGELHALYPDLYCVVDDSSHSDMALQQFQLPVLHHTPQTKGTYQVPHIADAQMAAIVFTSGSTGKPVGHGKTWGKLCINAQAEGKRMAITPSHGVVGTVPAQHMFGFESTVLMPWQMGAALHAGKPFYASDVMQAIAQVPAPRCLVSTPFHLRTFVDSGLAWPTLDLIICATAPLSQDLARQVELATQAKLLEIYGSTESGQLASRHTAQSTQWHTLDGAQVKQVGLDNFASGTYVEGDILLSDVLELHSPTCFTLLGRNADMVNIAGKRSSLSYLSQQLCAIDGVLDGVFYLPEQTHKTAAAQAQDIQRLAALVVAPNMDRATVLTQLRGSVDAVFLPRHIQFVAQLPRNSTGKLTAAALSELLLSLASANTNAVTNAQP